MTRRPPSNADDDPRRELPEGAVPLLDPSRQFWHPRPRTVLLVLVLVGGAIAGATWLGLRKTPAQRAADLLHMAQDALAGDRPDDAKRFLTDALAINPGNPEVLHTIAAAAMRQERFEEAEKTLRLALSSNPRHQASNVLLARLLVRLERGSEAREFLDRAVESAGPDPAPWFARCDARLDAGDLGGALADLRGALELAKDDDSAARCVLAGHLADFLGRTTWSVVLQDEAAARYRLAPTLAPRRGAVAPQIAAEAHVGAGRTHSALAILAQAQVPADATTTVLRCEALRLEGLREEAELRLRDVIQRADAAPLHAALARLLAEDGRIRAAAGILQEANRRFPNDLGVIHARIAVAEAAAAAASPADLLAAVVRTDSGTFNPMEPLLALRALEHPAGVESVRAGLGLRGPAAVAETPAGTEASAERAVDLQSFEKDVDALLAGSPDDPFGRLWKAAVRLRRGDFRGAVDDLGVAIASDAAAEATPGGEPSAAPAARPPGSGGVAQAGVAGRARLLRALARSAAGNWTEALEDVREAAALGAPPAVAASVETTAWIGLGDRVAARTVARRAAARWPQDPNVLWALSRALLPGPDEAIDAAAARERESIETKLRLGSMDPDAVRAAVKDLTRRAESDGAAAEALAGMWDDAAAAWAERERESPADAKAAMGHAGSLVRAGRPRQAEAVLRRAAERMPDERLALARVRLLSGIGAYDAADEVLRPLLAARPTDLPLQLESARLRIARGDEFAAGEALRAIVASPEAPASTRAEAASSLLTADVVPAADAELVLGWLASPAAGEVDDGTRRVLTGQARLALGHPEEAAAEGEAVLASGAPRPDAAILVARSWLAAGRVDRAEDLLLRALVRSPDDRRLRGLASHVRLLLGLRAFDAGDRAAASRWWESSITGGELDFMTAAVLADLYARRGDLKETSTVVRRVSTLRTSSAAIPLLRGHFEVAFGRPAVAAADYAEALSRAPSHPAVLAAFVAASARTGDLDGAERACKRAIDAGDRIGTAHTLLAGVRERRGDVDGAIDSLREACRRDPGNFGALAGLVELLDRSGRRDEARAAAQSAQAASTRDGDPAAVAPVGTAERFARMRLVVELGPVVGSIDRLRDVFSGRPTSWGAELSIGRALALTGDLEHARTWIERAVADAPDELAPQAALLRVLSDLGRLAEAERRILERTALHPDDSGAWCLLGMIADQRGDLAAAEVHYRRALAVAPGQAIAVNNLACTVFDQPGRQQEAIDLAAAAVRARPEVPELAATHAWLLLRAGRPDAATWALDDAVRLHPEFALIRLHRAEAAMARKQDAAAVSEYREALRFDASMSKRASAALRDAYERAPR